MRASGGSGSSIPGIARSTRSPPDGSMPMTPRVSQARMPSMGHDDYQRMLLQQQQQQIRRRCVRVLRRLIIR
jgi:hypothetical protein